MMLLISTSCSTFDSFIVKPEEYSFKTKEEVIYAVKDEVEILNEFINEVIKMPIATFSIIEKPKTKKVFKNSISLDISNIDQIFEKFKIKYISIYKKDKILKFEVKFNTFSNYCGFYYSYDNNAIYDNQDWKDEYPLIHKNNWTLLFESRYGWYTEKICDNWFYYENYEGPRKVIGYIEDDLKDMGYYDRIIKEIEEYEQKRDRYRK